MWLEEFYVEVVSTCWRLVNRAATLEYPGRLPVVKETDERSAIVQRLAAPVFKIAKEVVKTAVRAKVGAGVVSGRSREVGALTTYDGSAVKAGSCGSNDIASSAWPLTVGLSLIHI